MIIALLHLVKINLSDIWGGINIVQENKYTYISQKEVACEIEEKLGCSANDVFRMLNALSDVVKDKFSDINDMEIKIFPGLKVTSKHIPLEQFNTNLKNVNMTSDSVLKVSAYFTDNFKKEIRKHNN